MKKSNILFILVIFISSGVFSQEGRQYFQNRIMYTKYTVSDFFGEDTKWAWELDVVYRRQSELNQSDFWSEPLRMSVRPWIAYQATKLTRISFNPIGLFNSAPRYSQESAFDNDLERELRTTLQINHYAYAGRFNFTHRLRFESRWRGIDLPDGPVQNFRVRYRMRTRIPLNTDYFYTNNTLYLSQYSEMHVEFGKNYGTNYLSQNRNYIGLGYRFWDWTRIELGYIYQLNTTRSHNIEVSRGPMFYLFMDILSKNKRKYDYSY
ncbi:MAG: DUF2490 domain-containing protein [Flavobacterium sp.]